MTSISAGLLVTRVSGDSDLGAALAGQLLSAGRAMRFASYVIGGLALVPGLPIISFLVLAITLWVLGGRVQAPAAEIEEVEEVEISPDSPEALIGEMRVEPLELRLAYDALDLVDTDNGGDLLDRVKALRRQIALELGIVVPLIRTRDDVSLPAGTYTIELEGAEVARGVAPRDQVMALPASETDDLRSLGGTQTTEPVFGLAAWWIPDASSSHATGIGATVVDRSSVIVTHLADVVRRNADRLLTRQDVQQLVDGLRYDQPILAKEVDSDGVALGVLHRVLQSLLQEGVSIRQLGRVVEALSSVSGQPLDDMLAAARVALGPSIVHSVDAQARFSAVTIEPMAEVALHEALREVDHERRLVLDPEVGASLIDEVRQVMAGHLASDPTLIVVCGPGLRRPLQRFLVAAHVDVPVLAYAEIPSTVDITGIAVIGAGLQPGAPLAVGGVADT